jgi:uncharacterized protein (DUF58 family)
MWSRRVIVFGLLLACLIGALVTGRDLFYNLVYLWLAVIVIAGVWTWTAINRIRISRHTRALRAQVGRPLEERLAVRNTSAFPKLWLEVRDHSDLPGHEASLVVDSLAAGRERVWVVRSLCRERGRFRLGPLSLTSGDPFGLFQVTRQVPQTTNIVVYPMTFDLPDFTLPLGPMPGGDALRRRTHYVTANASGVRDYAPGDSFNRIHWRSTARRDRLIVKEFELDPLSDIWIFLDGDRDVQASLAPSRANETETPAPLWVGSRQKVTLPASSEEYGVSVAATLAQYFIRHDRTVGLITYGRGREIVQPDRSERQLTKMLETLAVFRAEGRVHLADALSIESQQLPRWSTLIIVTSASDTEWVLAAQSLKRHGLRVVAVVVDAGSFGGYTQSGVVEALWSAGIPAFRIKNGEDIVSALSYGSWTTQRFGGSSAL